MKELISLDPSEPVRNPLETCGKGIVSYIPFKFASQNLTNTAFRHKLPTAYFYRGTRFYLWRKNSPLAQKFAKLQPSPIESKFRARAFLHHWCIFTPARIASATNNR